jgi:hypothetical protein
MRSLQIVTNPAAWTPDGSGDQIVTITQTGPNTFTYPGPTSHPGAFTSGTWNYPLEFGITIKSATSAAYIANVLSARVAIASFDAGTQTSTQINNFAAAMRGPYNWITPDGAGYQAGQWTFVNCGMAGKNPPVAFVKYAGLNGLEGNEFTIIDAQPQRSFAGIVSGGGSSNRYKVRYDGTNWVRVG